MKCKQFSSKVHLSLRFKWKNRPQKLQKQANSKPRSFAKMVMEIVLWIS